MAYLISPALVYVAEYYDQPCLSLSVCLSVRAHILGTTCPNFCVCYLLLIGTPLSA